MLFPPNHKLVAVTVSPVVDDACDASPTLRLVSITSNEGDLADGSGHTSPDIQDAQFGTDDRQLLLRAERRGAGSESHLHDHLRGGGRERQRDLEPGDRRGAEELILRRRRDAEVTRAAASRRWHLPSLDGALAVAPPAATAADGWEETSLTWPRGGVPARRK